MSSAAEPQSSDFFFAGGSLQRDAPCYVTRKADADLLDALRRHQFCYVLTSRQMGKSSLMVRAAQSLREAGVAVVVLDLTALGQNLDAEQWYYGMLSRFGRQLRLREEMETCRILYWTGGHPYLTQKLCKAVAEDATVRTPGDVDRLCDALFFSSRARETENNLRAYRKRFGL